jgi:hypothetical protein
MPRGVAEVPAVLRLVGERMVKLKFGRDDPVLPAPRPFGGSAGDVNRGEAGKG